MWRRPVIHRFRRLIECGRVNELAVNELPDAPLRPLRAFARRAELPDPSGNGKFPTAQQLGVGSSQYQAAENACQSLLPSGTNDQYPAAEVPLLLR